MVIPRTLSAEQFSEAPEADQSLYQKGEDGNYNFVGENAGELKRGKDRVAEERNTFKEENVSLQEKLKQYEEKEKLSKYEEELMLAKDQEEREKVLGDKHSEELSEAQQRIFGLEQQILGQHRDKVIAEKAAEIGLSDFQHVVKLILRDRINVTFNDNNSPVVVVYDEQGNPTNQSVDELTKQIVGDKRYAGILRGAQVGSGTGATETASQKPVGDETVQDSKERLDKMLNRSPSEWAELIKKRNLLKQQQRQMRR